MPYANTEAMQQFLDRFAATIADDEHVVMVLDQAGWHDARALSVPANVTLVALPPYSPELNPVERVWLYLKERFLSHRLHDDYEAIVNAACKAWRRLTAQAGRIRSLCTYPWIPKVKTRVDGIRAARTTATSCQVCARPSPTNSAILDGELCSDRAKGRRNSTG